jgi:HD-GYP domain-containing protein (c-di-GMP phosphodiesterase class II)
VQILLGDVCDALFETGAPRLTTTDSARDNSLYAMAQQATTPELPSLVVPLVNESGVEAVALLWVATNDGLIAEEYRAPLHAAARQGGAMLASARACELGGSAERDFGLLLAEAADMREPYRTGHSSNVAHWCGVIARGMNLNESEVERCELAGLLHGMGKITVPDEILQKSFALSDDERASVRKAIVSGGDRLMQVRGLEEVALAVRHQSECWNGTGLPDALAGDAIPLGARILAVALRFCAMTRSRAGRRAMSIVGGAFETLATDSGTVLDPKVVRAFLAAMGRTMDIPRIALPDTDVSTDKTI